MMTFVPEPRAVRISGARCVAWSGSCHGPPHSANWSGGRTPSAATPSSCRRPSTALPEQGENLVLSDTQEGISNGTSLCLEKQENLKCEQIKSTHYLSLMNLQTGALGVLNFCWFKLKNYCLMKACVKTIFANLEALQVLCVAFSSQVDEGAKARQKIWKTECDKTLPDSSSHEKALRLAKLGTYSGAG